ncbi:short chain dehydrogenase [Whalleya microplaca]|nr:short chain dehydrogenase [Whalleya microplaca]
MGLAPNLTTLSALGALLLLTGVYETLNFIWLYVRPSNLRRYPHATAGKPAWALVTGASDGIGKAIAFELASEGFNVLLHGRNSKKLEGVRGKLSQAHPARSFRVWIADASRCHMDTAWLDEATKTIEDINLTVLVNNAGGNVRPTYGTLEKYSPQAILDTVHVNAVFPVLLSAAIIPILIKNGPSLIINICSLSDNGMPLVSFYGATKAFDRALSQSLWREMKLEGRDIEVIAHRVGMTTETQYIQKKTSMFRPPAMKVAKAVLERTGCGRKLIVPYWGHALQDVMVKLFPTWIMDKMIINAMRDLRTEQDANKVD